MGSCMESAENMSILDETRQFDIETETHCFLAGDEVFMVRKQGRMELRRPAGALVYSARFGPGNGKTLHDAYKTVRRIANQKGLIIVNG
jgi:hypothetical protein